MTSSNTIDLYNIIENVLGLFIFLLIIVIPSLIVISITRRREIARLTKEQDTSIQLDVFEHRREVLNVEKQYKTAVVLLSGGLDSCVTSAYLKWGGYSVTNLYLDFGTTTSKMEWERAQEISKYLGQEIIKTDCHLPFSNTKESKTKNEYVPLRNLVAMSIASSYAEKNKISFIGIGVDSLGDEDTEAFNDTKPTFIKTFEEAINLGIQGDEGIGIITIVQGCTKEEILELGRQVGAPVELTYSCINEPDEDGNPCGICDKCLIRQQATNNVEQDLQDLK